MKKLTILCLMGLSLIAVNEVKAQVSVGANLGMFKAFSEGSDAEFGVNLVGKYEINDKIRVGANLGYFFKSYNDYGNYRVFTMPVTGLFEYSFNDNDFSPYAGADIGIYRFGISGGGQTSASSYLGMAPVVGGNYKLSDKLLINANVKFHYILSEISTKALGINAGVIYKL
jgi:outer membrane protein W